MCWRNQIITHNMKPRHSISKINGLIHRNNEKKNKEKCRENEEGKTENWWNRKEKRTVRRKYTRTSIWVHLSVNKSGNANVSLQMIQTNDAGGMSVLLHVFPSPPRFGHRRVLLKLSSILRHFSPCVTLMDMEIAVTSQMVFSKDLLADVGCNGGSISSRGGCGVNQGFVASGFLHFRHFTRLQHRKLSAFHNNDIQAVSSYATAKVLCYVHREALMRQNLK